MELRSCCAVYREPCDGLSGEDEGVLVLADVGKRPRTQLDRREYAGRVSPLGLCMLMPLGPVFVIAGREVVTPGVVRFAGAIV
jgi:hypothetical protein